METEVSGDPVYSSFKLGASFVITSTDLLIKTAVVDGSPRAFHRKLLAQPCSRKRRVWDQQGSLARVLCSTRTSSESAVVLGGTRRLLSQRSASAKKESRKTFGVTLTTTGATYRKQRSSLQPRTLQVHRHSKPPKPLSTMDLST